MSFLKRALRPVLRRHGWEFRRFDPDLCLETFLPMLIDHFGINCVLDVGACRGEYGALLREANYRGLIFSFEPVPENFARLQARIGRDPRWLAQPYALGNQEGSIEMNVAQGTHYSSFLTPNDAALSSHTPLAVARPETVQVRRLDAVFADLTRSIQQPRVFLKMDTQGWDLEVFQGAQACLEHVVALQTELSLLPLYQGMPDWQTAIGRFEEKDFAVSALFPLWRDDNMRLGEVDCVMVRTACSGHPPRGNRAPEEAAIGLVKGR